MMVRDKANMSPLLVFIDLLKHTDEWNGKCDCLNKYQLQVKLQVLSRNTPRLEKEVTYSILH